MRSSESEAAMLRYLSSDGYKYQLDLVHANIFTPPSLGEVRAYRFAQIGLYAVLLVFSYVGRTPILLRKMILEDCVRKLLIVRLEE